MTGWENQITGDVAQVFVQNELVPRGFLVGTVVPDPGEDFWVEWQGRRAIAEGSFPMRALIQAKGASSVQDNVFTEDLPVKKIVRWASQPLPVFIVGVATSSPPSFYAKSIDEVVQQDLEGRDPTTVTTKTIRVRLPYVNDLSELLSTAIADHHRSLRLELQGVSDTDIEQHYFEVLEKKRPQGWEEVPTASWRVLWRSAPRPQHFAAMLTELARRAGAEYATAVPRPAFVMFHVYRSLYDEQHNLAVARVDWVDPTHPQAQPIADVLGTVGQFRVRHDRDVPGIREFLRSRTADTHEFAAYAEMVGQAFDAIADVILAADGVATVWDEVLRARFKEADRLWNDGPFPPVQHTALNDALRAYYAALSEHEYVAVYRKEALAPDVTTRLLRGSASRLRDARGAWRVFLPDR